jgi:hypothetical protein
MGDSDAEPEPATAEDMPTTQMPEQQQMPAEADSAKTLYMFSDIEGCQVLDRNGTQLPFSNSIAMCDPQFYSKLEKMMENKPNMHVAFLGDYFDQGLKVIPSLKGMSDLYDKYKGRVFIILGNRDINKLRFMYELTHTIAPLTQGGWSDWTKFYNGLAGKENVELVKHILSTSMGAPIQDNQDKGQFVGLHSFIPPDNQKDKSDEEALDYLKASFGMGTAEGAFDILAFYNNCKIAHVFDLGNNEKVLLAHGGGFNKGCFFNKAYIDSFGKSNGNVNPNNYLQMMENFRIKLSQPPSVPVQKGGVLSGKEIRDRQIKFDNERRANLAAEAAAEKAAAEAKAAAEKAAAEAKAAAEKAAAEAKAAAAISVQASVDVYNQLLLDVVNELTTNDGDAKYTWKFVLLQALGLKPNADSKKQDKIYNSLVQSCSQNGCTGQSSYIPESPDKERELYEYLKSSGITHVSYGHKPVCFPIPLMYSRANMPEIMFISNDTSNGNRRTEDLGSTIVVGTKIDFSSNPSVASICYISTIPGDSSETDKTEDVKKFKDQFQPFLDLKLTKKNAPEYNDNKLTYGNGLVVSMNAEGHEKLKFTPPPQSAASEGGRRSRRRRYTKKIKQRSKRRVQKKRAATRSKRERKTRK